MQPRFPSDQGPTEDQNFDRIAEDLERQGYAIVPGIVSPAITDALFVDFKSLEAGAFKRAGVGRQDDFQLNRFVRSDRICWLRGESAASAAFLEWAERLRRGLNQRLFLGLFDYECHYANYPVGAFYKKHLDAFKGQASRVLSTVFYLNPNWQSADGGELVLYDESDSRVMETVIPEYGKLVIFLSEQFPHEVLPSQKPRHSIAGWFRMNNTSATVLDPPG